jgi:two-component system, chemotaxis family, chemotaxis protein CheY
MMIKKILIVDDSPISRRMLKSCLPKDREFEIFEAGDGLAGFEGYKLHAPDVTFMDLTMPVMDGVQSLCEIRKFDQDAVVIVCTADVQVKSLDKVRENGAFHVVKKPPTKDSISMALSLVEERGN